MTGIRTRGEDIRKFIIENIEKYPSTIGKIAANKFSISRQAVNKHIHRLCTEHALIEKGNTKNKKYALASLSEFNKTYLIKKELAEDLVWKNDVWSFLNPLPDNVRNIWNYGFTEMFNNAIDHSEGSEIYITINKTAVNTEIMIHDNGIGIFKKIQTALGLLDERHAILELSKGKLTTDPSRHSGEGIFFTSRMFDSFDILSGGVFFTHAFGNKDDWMLEREKFINGTTVFMKLNNHTSRNTKKIFDKYSSGDDYGFNNTVIPVKLAQYGNDLLISRSQAKRLLARIEVFKQVIFDFKDVNTIGQAFADEIFRVFALEHPEIELTAINANSEVKKMISRSGSITNI
jgi:anti-sigma regulatory factor (Ser/Thr protein kinase)